MQRPYDIHIAPDRALQLLKEGNFRFVNRLNSERDLLYHVAETKDGQKPFAVILGCMDSRVSSELIFDQGLGDIFSIRIAGNIVSEGILGSIEYATAVAGASLVLVLGHTNCGAIKGACDHVEMGHLTGLLQKIQPALDSERTFLHERNSNNTAFVNAVTDLNIQHSARQILQQSQIIRDLVVQGKVQIASAMYNVATGMVTFNDDQITSDTILPMAS